MDVLCLGTEINAYLCFYSADTSKLGTKYVFGN